MKVLIVLAAVAVSCVSAGGLRGYGAPALPLGGPLVAPVAAPVGVAVASSGSSQQFRAEDNYGNYQFGYDEAHASGSSGRREERHGDIVRGSYNLADADGRRRTVNYVADDSGFHASVQTNEPGVDSARDPADVLINKEAVAVAAPVAAPAPLPVPVVAKSAPLALPLAAPAPIPAAPVFRAPVFAAKTIATPLPAPLAAPVAVAAPVAAPVYEAAPVSEPQSLRAFSYSFGNTHPSLLAAPGPVPAPVALAAPAPIVARPAPIFQQGLKY